MFRPPSLVGQVGPPQNVLPLVVPSKVVGINTTQLISSSFKLLLISSRKPRCLYIQQYIALLSVLESPKHYATSHHVKRTNTQPPLQFQPPILSNQLLELHHIQRHLLRAAGPDPISHLRKFETIPVCQSMTLQDFINKAVALWLWVVSV